MRNSSSQYDAADRDLLGGWSFFGTDSESSKYDGQRGNGEYCYNVNVAGGTLCCDSTYNMDLGFKKGSVCYLGDEYSCVDLAKAKFTSDGVITMDKALIGLRAFPSIETGHGWRIEGDPSTGDDSSPFEYSITRGHQNGLITDLTGNAPAILDKSFLVSGWDEKNDPSDHEIEWAGPTTIGLGGETFNAPAVIMKGNTSGLIYLDDLDGILHGSGYKTPVNPESGLNEKTHEVEFCFDYSPASPGSVYRDGEKGDKGAKKDETTESTETTETEEKGDKGAKKDETTETTETTEEGDKGEKKDDGKKEHKIDICHATCSDKNPYNILNIDESAWETKGHSEHQDCERKDYKVSELPLDIDLAYKAGPVKGTLGIDCEFKEAVENEDEPPAETSAVGESVSVTSEDEPPAEISAVGDSVSVTSEDEPPAEISAVGESVSVSEEPPVTAKKPEKKIGGSSPGIKGDPHIKKWDGTQYDFQ